MKVWRGPHREDVVPSAQLLLSVVVSRFVSEYRCAESRCIRHRCDCIKKKMLLQTGHIELQIKTALLWARDEKSEAWMPLALAGSHHAQSPGTDGASAQGRSASRSCSGGFPCWRTSGAVSASTNKRIF